MNPFTSRCSFSRETCRANGARFVHCASFALPAVNNSSRKKHLAFPQVTANYPRKRTLPVNPYLLRAWKDIVENHVGGTKAPRPSRVTRDDGCMIQGFHVSCSGDLPATFNFISALFLCSGLKSSTESWSEHLFGTRQSTKDFNARPSMFIIAFFGVSKSAPSPRSSVS